MPSQGTQEGATASPAEVAVDMVKAHRPEGRLQAADASDGRSRRAVVNIGSPTLVQKAAPSMKTGEAEGHGQVQTKRAPNCQEVTEHTPARKSKAGCAGPHRPAGEKKGRRQHRGN